MQLPEDAADEDLYQWFIASLAHNGEASETQPDVIRVVVGKQRLRDDPSTEAEPESAEQIVWVHLTRAQLRSVCYEEFNIFDDTDLHVVPRTNTPVWQGLVAFDFYTDEAIATLRPGEGHLVFHEGALHGSTVPTTPPVRSNRFW